MATTTNLNIAYKGGIAGELFVEAFKASDTIAKSAITIIPNVIGSGFLPKLSWNADLQSGASCGFDPSGTLDYSDKEVVTRKYKFDGLLCKEDFAQTFQAKQLGLFGANENIPSTIMGGIIEAMMGNMGEVIDHEIWNGTNTATSFDGFLPQFVADADVIDVAGTAITAANVQDEIAKVYDVIPAEIIDDKDLVFVVSLNVAKAYRQSQIGVGTLNSTGAKELDYLGLELTSIAGLPVNTMVVYRRKNLGFLTGLESDYNQVRVVDMDESDLSGNVGTQIKFTAGVGYSDGKEVVYYTV